VVHQSVAPSPRRLPQRYHHRRERHGSGKPLSKWTPLGRTPPLCEAETDEEGQDYYTEKAGDRQPVAAEECHDHMLALKSDDVGAVTTPARRAQACLH
jgi:hypothetical protein